MNESEIRAQTNRVRDGSISRRQFTRMMMGLGLSAPMAAHMLASAGLAQAQTKLTTAKRGGGGAVRVLWRQAPTLLNPHFANGTKDQDASRIFYEPLASFDPDGHVVPNLAADVPTVRNGGVARDGTSVTWHLKKTVAWHDGKPFTADDVVFNWEYAVDLATAAVTTGTFSDVVRIDKLDPYTVKIVFGKPKPFPYTPFCGPTGQIIPKHLFEAFKGSASREAPANLKPVGTGAYRFVDFKPGESVRAELNPTYHEANRPHFDTVELKGGGDAVSAARAVIQAGEFDYAWNIQVEDDILRRLEQGGKGRVNVAWGGDVEHIQLNSADPWREVDGERSSVKAPHPLLGDPAVRQALNVLIERGEVQEQIYGRAGKATANFLNAPAALSSRNTKWELNITKANELLDSAGWRRGPDGIRAKDGKRLKLVYQTSINAPRQKTQAIVKQASAKAGIEIEIKSVVASVFFASDPANWDTYPHFAADLQMYTTGMTQPDPQRLMDQFVSWELASKENKWLGRNITRWRNEEYDRLWKAADSEMDAVKRAAMFVRMNDLLIQNVVVIPVLWRSKITAASLKLRDLDISGWDSDLSTLASWSREA